MNGQLSLFNGLLIEECDTKPDIGTELIFHYDGLDYPCKVKSHCGMDYFYIVFIGEQTAGDTDGWHVSLRGYKKDWDYA